MSVLENFALVFVAGFVTALATGLGALPFFVVDEVGDRWNVALWGVASGIMVSASVFGLIFEGLANGTVAQLVPGLVVGVALVEVADRVLDRFEFGGDDDERAHEHGHAHDHDRAHDHGHDVDAVDRRRDEAHAVGHDGGHDHEHVDPEAFVEGDVRKLVLILGVLTVHSFPEGVAIGVSFADLNLAGGYPVFGFAVPVLAVFMTAAISVHNIPEGLAISIPLQALGVSKWRMVGAAVFSSLPQPIGAVIAFGFVRYARSFLPFGFGFAAGAMIYLVVTEFIPEALDTGAHLPRRGYPELVAGVVAGVLVMVPLAFV